MVFKIIKGGSDRLISYVLCYIMQYAICYNLPVKLKLFVPYQTVKTHKLQALSNSCLKIR